MSEPTAAAAPLSTPTDDVLALAEVLGDIKTRFERLEAEHATQSAPLAAAAQALQAALAGLTALKSHVLENSIAVLSTRVEDQRRAIDEQVTSLVAELRAADQQAAQFTRSESEAIRASLAELRSHFERTAREFSARAERFDLEIKAAATRFAASPVAPGRDGASFSPAGTWSASQAGGYKRLSVVSYLGGSFVSNEDGNTEKPGPKSIKWTQLAARGPGGGSGDISGLTGVATANQGGTGITSYTTGDILYASSATTLAKLGAGSAGQFLVSNGAGAAPAWGTGTSGALPSMTGNADKILITDGTNASWLATDSITTVLRTTNTTAATNTTSGALRVGSNIGLSGNSGGSSYFGGAVVIRPTAAQSGLDISNTQANQASINLRASDVGSVDWRWYRDSSNALNWEFNGSGRLSLSSAGVFNVPATTSASSSTVGALTIGAGSAATNVAIGGGNINAGGTITTGLGVAWNLGAAASVSPTSPNRTIAVNIGGTTLYIHAKTTND